MNQDNNNNDFLGNKRNLFTSVMSVQSIDDIEITPEINNNNNNNHEKKYQRNYDKNYQYRNESNFRRKPRFRYANRRDNTFKRNTYRETDEERHPRHYIIDNAFTGNNIEIYKGVAFNEINIEDAYLIKKKSRQEFNKNLDDFSLLVKSLFDFNEKSAVPSIR